MIDPKAVETNSIVNALLQPEDCASLDLKEWDKALRQARNTRLLPRLAIILRDLDIYDSVPEKVKPHLVSACAIAEQHERITRWEVNRIERALDTIDAPVILLKGAAYVLAKLPPARGRLSSDVDILVPKDKLAIVESALHQNGWEDVKVDQYDQRYFRQWMHELPPLRHRERNTNLDVHHTILPETGRLHPDPAELIRAARPIDGAKLLMLAPADMVLHSAAHMFEAGEIGGSLRDLFDLDDLFKQFGRDHEFWHRLVPRAEELDLIRPLYYALRYTRQILGTPIPDEVTQAASINDPPKPILRLMDYLVRQALIPYPPVKTPHRAALARWMLYVRSHWLRMPPFLLTQHLTRKAFRGVIERWEKRREDQDIQHAEREN